MFVLDTNTVVDYFKGKGKVAERLLSVPPRDIALPAIVTYEVWVGVLGSQMRSVDSLSTNGFCP